MARKSPERIAALALIGLLATASSGHGSALEASLVPKPRPMHLTASLLDLSSVPSGSVCGVAAIKGERLEQVGPGEHGCGIATPVRVTSVSGVKLSPAAVFDCTTAKALNHWVATNAKPAFGDNQGGLAGLHVAASYVCRTRNRKAGAKMSEHALGHAVDISGFDLRDGGKVTVQDGWKGDGSKTLKRLHSAACRTFGTVLGPDSDSHHHDHFHFDTARYRNGAYCR